MTVKRFNKFFAVFALALLLLSFGSHFVSAQSNGIERAWEGFKNAVGGDLGNIFAQLGDTSNGLLVRLLFYFLVFLVIGSILTYIPLFSNKNWFIRGTLSLVITALSVLFIPKELLINAINPYTALGVTVITILPFILMFVFIHRMVRNKFFKDAIWFLFGATLAGLAVVSYFSATGLKQEIYSLAYGIGAIAAWFAIWFGEYFERKKFEGELDALEKDLKSKGKTYAEIAKARKDFLMEMAMAEQGLTAAQAKKAGYTGTGV